MSDQTDGLRSAVVKAIESGQPLYIRGGDSKRQMVGRSCNAGELDVSGHRGIIDYQPDELVISARAGTPLSEIVETLEQHQQILPFESPLFDGRATAGGTLASNLSGPARPWAGSIRDATLGLALINGHGDLLQFGGKVMKNVAGYDVSRLQAGALGTLGLITEIHLKVLPRPEYSQTLIYEMSAADALHTMNRRSGEPKPLSAACWIGGRLFLRLSGAASAVSHTAKVWGGERCPDSEVPWESLREMTLPFFSGHAPLWRLSTSPTTAIEPEQSQLLDWGGAQRWIRCEADSPTPVASTGHLTLFRGGDRESEVMGELDPVQKRLQRRLKDSFDPRGVFNPGRLYSWM